VGRKPTTGGVEPKANRIQLTFSYRGKRYRPTLDLAPTQANLRHAARRLEEIKHKIRTGSFVFAEEFPGYRFLDAVTVTVTRARPTFDQVADAFLASIGGLDFATRESYRKILNAHWRSKFGKLRIDEIRYGELAAHIGGRPWGSMKTRNNVASVGRLVFGFAHADELIERNPMDRIKTLRVQKAPPDPYAVEEAEALLAGILADWGEHDANYFEFAFFTGLRPSEEIALLWSDADLQAGRLRVERARVMGRDKATTKTYVARLLELCPRSLEVLRRQRELTGLADREVFTHPSGDRYRDLQAQLKRWDHTHKRLGLRRRVPYQTRHTSVTWNLMTGKNLLWVAEQHGHSPAVMLKTYARWTSGATEEDIEAIRCAMAAAPMRGFANGFATRVPLRTTKPLIVLAEREGFEPSIRV